MKIGVAMFITDETVQPVELGRMVEERGLDSLFVPEHTHIPVSRETLHPTRGELSREYARTLDPFVALAAVAATTSRILVGTAVCLLVQRDPIVTAKAAATVDLVSGGRFVFGVGAGWNLEEMRDHGTDPATRFALLRERVEAVRALWTEDEVSYQGAHVRFAKSWCWPKPVQKPHPPILLGGVGPKVLERVLAYGDGWIPHRDGDDERLCARIVELRRRAREELGRADVTVTVTSAPEPHGILARFAEAGAERVVVWLPPAKMDAVEPVLDQLAAAVGKI